MTEPRKVTKKEDRGFMSHSAPSLLLKAAMIQSDKVKNMSSSPTSIAVASQGIPLKSPNPQIKQIPGQTKALNERHYTGVPVDVVARRNINVEAIARDSPSMTNHQTMPSNPGVSNGQNFGTSQPIDASQQPFTTSFMSINSHTHPGQPNAPALIAPRPASLVSPVGVKKNPTKVQAVSRPNPLSNNFVPTGRTFDGGEVNRILDAFEKHLAVLQEDHINEMRHLRTYFDARLNSIAQLLQATGESANHGERRGILPDQHPGTCHFTVHAGGVITIGTSEEKSTRHAVAEKVVTAGERYKLSHLGDYKSDHNSNDTCSSSSSDFEGRNLKPSTSSKPIQVTGPMSNTNAASHQDVISVNQQRVPNLQLPIQSRKQRDDVLVSHDVLGKRRSPAATLPSNKRKRDNWTEAENFKFMNVVMGNPELEEMDLRRLLAKTFSPRRTHEQCANHLRILRAQGRLPQAKDETQKSS